MRVFVFSLLYAKGSLDLVRWIFGGAISPELSVKSVGSARFLLFYHLGPNEASYNAHRHVVLKGMTYGTLMELKSNMLWTRPVGT